MAQPLTDIRPDDPRLATGTDVPAPEAPAASRMGDWYEAHGRAVYNYFRFLGAMPDEAEDLCAETFLRAIRAQDVYDPSRASARTWLCRIAHNAWCDTLRRARRRRSMPIAAFRDLAVDAPSQWGVRGGSRLCEQQLRRLAIQSYGTPSGLARTIW